MIYAQRQWRRLSTYETYQGYASAFGYSPPLSSRVAREMEWACNNAKGWVFAPRRQFTFFPKLASAASTTNQRVMAVFAPMVFPDGYDYIRWDIGHERFAGSGAEKTTWRLYCSWSLYTGPDIFDASYLSSWYLSDSLETDSDTHGFDGSRSLKVCRDADSLVWLVLTAQNSTTAVRSRLTSLSITGRCA